MKEFIIVSPVCGQESAWELAKLLEVQYYNIDDVPTINENTHIINYGCSRLPKIEPCKVFNRARAVRRSLNKLRTFELLKGYVPLPSVTTDKEEALKWVADGRKVVIRNKVKSNSIQGVTITKWASKVKSYFAKFYTRYIEHENELRVNCYRGKVVSVYRKTAVKNSKGEPDFVFKYMPDYLPDLDCDVLAQTVYDKLKVDTCGLDVLVTAKGNVFLLEVNSAAILFPITAKRIAKLIQKDFINA